MSRKNARGTPHPYITGTWQLFCSGILLSTSNFIPAIYENNGNKTAIFVQDFLAKRTIRTIASHINMGNQYFVQVFNSLIHINQMVKKLKSSSMHIPIKKRRKYPELASVTTVSCNFFVSLTPLACGQLDNKSITITIR